MPAKNPYAKQAEDRVYSASSNELTLMLYEGALKFANQALVALEKKDFLKVNELLQRAQDIVREFQLTLKDDFEISNNFRALYDYILRLLVDANLKKDKATLEEARDLLRDFRDMWKEAMTVTKQQGA